MERFSHWSNSLSEDARVLAVSGLLCIILVLLGQWGGRALARRFRATPSKPMDNTMPLRKSRRDRLSVVIDRFWKVQFISIH